MPRTLRPSLRTLILLACLGLCAPSACKRPDDDSASESEAADEPGGDEAGSDDPEAPADPGAKENGDDVEPAEVDDFDPGPVLDESFGDVGWSEALAAQWLPDTLGVAIVRPDNLLTAIESTRARVQDPDQREAFESLLTRLPSDFAALTSSRGWQWAGLDPDKPAAIWVSAGPGDVLEIFDTLQEDLIEGTIDMKVRGETIFEALQSLTLHLRVSLPYSDGRIALQTVIDIVGQGMRPISIKGYEKSFAAGSTIIAIRREGGRVVIDAVASQSQDPVTSVAGHLVGLKPVEPNLPRPVEDALVWVGLDMGSVAAVDAMYGAVQSDSGRPEALIRAITHDSPYDALTIALTPSGLVFAGHFEEPVESALEAVASARRIDRSGFGSDVAATVEFTSTLAQPGGLSKSLGFEVPSQELDGWKLDAFVGKSGPIVFALPLWLPLAPSVAWSFLEPEQRYLDPGTGWVAQLALPTNIDLTAPTARLAVAWPEGASPSAPVGCLLAGEPASDTCPPVTMGEPKAVALGPIAVDVVLDDRDGTRVLAAASTETLGGLREAALQSPSVEGSTRLASIRVDARAPLFAALLGGAAPPDQLLQAIGWLEVGLEASPTQLAVEFGAGDGRPLLTVLTDAGIALWLALTPPGGETTARSHLQRLATGALVAFDRPGADGKSSATYPPAAEAVCVGDGSPEATDPTSVDWSAEPWATLGFRAHASFQWKYCYQTSEKHDRFALWAEVDLDGDGTAEQRLCSGGFLVAGEPTLRMLNRGSGSTPCLP